MDFTREPIIETVITPKEGYKLVVKNSKNPGQEEYFVDALEVVSFGYSSFFRSLEKPKNFLVPVSDYEILEVREQRILLKTPAAERAIKIGGGRETRPIKEEKTEGEAPSFAPKEEGVATETRAEKKRERRRQQRRRRAKEDREETQKEVEPPVEERMAEVSGEAVDDVHAEDLSQIVDTVGVSRSVLSTIIPPPPTLISETIGQYKEKFRDAFYTREEAEAESASTEFPPIDSPDNDLFVPAPQAPSMDAFEEEHDSFLEETHHYPSQEPHESEETWNATPAENEQNNQNQP